RLLSRRAVPQGLLPPQPVPAVLHGRGGPEGGQGAQQVHADAPPGRRVRRTAALALLLPLAAVPLAAQQPPRFASRVDAYAREEMTRQGLVGLSVAVMREGKIVLERGYGFANLEHQAPATPATVYQSGSLGKQFTA